MNHRNCVSDPTARQWWRDYQKVCHAGNPLGLSFVEFVAHRVLAQGQVTHTEAAQAPWDVAPCGHKHTWGESCSSWTSAQ